MTDYIVRTMDVGFSYDSGATTSDGAHLDVEKNAEMVIKNLSIDIKKGSYVALLGRNGSGKSTLAKLIDVLELPDEGNVVVFGINTKDEEGFWEIRSNTGCVFQNPDNQIVGTIVEEDVAFGPENLGIPNPELRARVDESLKYVGLYDLRSEQAANLSGGQKQKLAIAGVLAMKPSILILDEATSMLDPVSRDEFLEVVERMNRDKKVTVITITHDMNEASRCEFVYVIDDGHVVLEGKPADVFARVDELYTYGLEAPCEVEFTNEFLKVAALSCQVESIRGKEACEKTIMSTFKYLSSMSKLSNFEMIESTEGAASTEEPGETILKLANINYSYDGTEATISDINLEVKKGEILGIIGRSGCGKTTLISHMNLLYRPKPSRKARKNQTNIGEVTLFVNGKSYSSTNNKDVVAFRENIGLVFQYPEYQLFEETVFKDIAFGPKQMKLDEAEQRKRVHEAIKLVGLKEDVLEKSPFELSGGQQRRVALAGVLSMKPQILVLDEPAAGLDPKGRRDMFTLIKKLRDSGVTIVLVSHNMDEVYAHADRICVVKDGRIVACDETQALFERGEDELSQMGISYPVLRGELVKIADLVSLGEDEREKLVRAKTPANAARLLAKIARGGGLTC